MPDSPTTALVKTAQSPALARVSNQLALTDKLLTKPEEPFLIPYRKGNKWGFCDRNKNIVIDCVYNEVRPFSKSYAKVQIGGSYGILNKKGSFYLKVESKYILLSLRKRITRTRAYKITTKCKDYALSSYDLINSFYYKRPDVISNIIIPVKRFNKWGYVNEKGHELIPFIYDVANPFSEGFACVKINNRYAFINVDGNYLKGGDSEVLTFDVADSFSEGYAAVMDYPVIDGKRECTWNYINKEGKLAQLLRSYDDAHPFENGYAFVSYEDVDSTSKWYKWYFAGYTDNKGIEYWEGPNRAPFNL